MKMISQLTGLGDGCSTCEISPRLWNNPDQIREGFPATRTLQVNEEVAKTAPRNKKGEIMRKGRDDWDRRKGVSRDPIAVRPLHTFTVTHKVIFCDNNRATLLSDKACHERLCRSSHYDHLQSLSLSPSHLDITFNKM